MSLITQTPARSFEEEIGRELPRRVLRPLERPAPRRRPRLAYGILAVAGAVAIAAAQMILSVLTTQGSFELSSLTQEQKELTVQRQVISEQVAGLGSPQYLAANASALGMVINEAPSYLRLSDGAVLGPQSASDGASAIDALGRGAVPNALIAGTPLVTEPNATIGGVRAPAAPAPAPAPAVDPTTPPAVTEGLPAPTTH